MILPNSQIQKYFTHIQTNTLIFQEVPNVYRLERDYLFNFMPFGMFSRLIFRIVHFMDPQSFWKNGLLGIKTVGLYIDAFDANRCSSSFCHINICNDIVDSKLPKKRMHFLLFSFTATLASVTFAAPR